MSMPVSRVFVIDQGLVIQGKQIPLGSLIHPGHVGPPHVTLCSRNWGPRVHQQTEAGGWTGIASSRRLGS
jgi:hypothetical protein